MLYFFFFQFTDFKNYAMTASLKDNPKLERSIALFNGLSQWIQCMVLSKTTPQQRADVIVKFCNVAKVRKIINTYKSYKYHYLNIERVKLCYEDNPAIRLVCYEAHLISFENSQLQCFDIETELFLRPLLSVSRVVIL